MAKPLRFERQDETWTMGLIITLALALIPCTCPPAAMSRDLVLVAPTTESPVLVVCGYTDQRRGAIVLAQVQGRRTHWTSVLAKSLPLKQSGSPELLLSA